MFIRFGLKPLSRSPMSVPPMVFRQAYVAIEEEDVGLPCEFCGAPYSSDPDQYFAGHEIEPKWPRRIHLCFQKLACRTG